ncbi:hypothetical protein [Bradyrhizobium sp. STM 3557]|uniref:hypothetical protein n=1 Tax=Bradyrhizobium sp. STM 3557 TaxID=578920 RepID=UPI0038901315
MTTFSAASRLAMLAVIAATSLAATSADAATKRRQDGTYVATGSNGPNVSYQQGPHTRIFISRRSWLDGGTEVLPGDRKFTDYALPSEYGYPSFGRENNNRPIDRQPLMTPTDLGGFPRAFPLPPVPY